jgi:outer membrane lipoprotein-sorting protein
MSDLRRSALFLATFAAALVPSAAALADEAGDAALAKVDAAMNRAKTQKFEYEVVNKEAGKDEKAIGMKVALKGDKRLTEFTAPADMKGTKVLILSPTEMYVYLPAFGKVRRIASSVSDQGFMGMTFSQDDFVTKYGPQYSAAVASDDAAQVKLVLTPKAGQTTPYAKIEMTVAKDKWVPTEIKLFNAEGKNVKTETRTGYTCQGDVCTATEQKMVDNTKGGAFTKMVRKMWQVNESISDDMFSKRALGE